MNDSMAGILTEIREDLESQARDESKIRDRIKAFTERDDFGVVEFYVLSSTEQFAAFTNWCQMVDIEFWNEVKKEPPHDKNTWVEIITQIRHNPTGEIVESSDTGIFENGIGLRTWIWEEGNFACDCNRYLFFERAKGNQDLGEESPHGHGLYSVRLINPKTKQIVYADPNWQLEDQT